MLTNDQMKAGRFLRLAQARKKVSWIVSHLEAGRTVQITSATKAWRYKGADKAGMFKATKSGAYVQQGKRWDCFDGCHLKAY